MSPRSHLIGALVLTVVGALAVVGVILGTRGSVREHIHDNYTLVRADKQQRSSEYKAPGKPSAVAAAIASKWKPSERITDPSGFFLRYRNDMVVVTAAERGTGSRIFVDDERRGYSRWYPYVGGYWGTYSGPGERFRGGGPGAGK